MRLKEFNLLMTLHFVRVSHEKSDDDLSIKGGLNVTFKKADQEGLDSMESGLE